MAVDKGLDFDVRVAPGVPETLLADEQRLQQVLRNLLSNAFKFTSEGEVNLDITRGNSPGTIAFSVTDTGIGISEDKLEIIFEAFQQADGTTSRRYGGTGLGLSISRDIARLLGGEVQAASRPGEGSTFTLILPADYDDSDARRAAAAGDGDARRRPLDPPGIFTESAAPAEDNQLDATLSGRKVLIVDDDVRNVFALTSVLEGYGMDVLYAENGRAGIDVLQRNPDTALVLMDIMMPELDGYATTETIRKMPQFSELPIVVITAKVMKGDREKSMAAGASDYVPKPVDVEHLLDVMRNWLQRG
jgi:CheY-like chemotaxis protein